MRLNTWWLSGVRKTQPPPSYHLSLPNSLCHLLPNSTHTHTHTKLCKQEQVNEFISVQIVQIVSSMQPSMCNDKYIVSFINKMHFEFQKLFFQPQNKSQQWNKTEECIFPKEMFRVILIIILYCTTLNLKLTEDVNKTWLI